MSQISIGMKNPKKRWAPTAKQATYNIKSIHGPVINNKASLQDTSDKIDILAVGAMVRISHCVCHWHNFIGGCIHNCFEATTAKRRDSCGYPGIEGYHGYV